MALFKKVFLGTMAKNTRENIEKIASAQLNACQTNKKCKLILQKKTCLKKHYFRIPQSSPQDFSV
jgi:hypothetical protein